MTTADMSNSSNWIILDPGNVDMGVTNKVAFMCIRCSRESLLPVVGAVLAQSGLALVFDIGPHEMPRKIRCPHCRKTLETEE